MGVVCLPLFCYALICAHFMFAIIWKKKRKLVDLLLLSYRCSVTIYVLWLFLTVPWLDLHNVVFLDHTHLLFDNNENLRFQVMQKALVAPLYQKNSCLDKKIFHPVSTLPILSYITIVRRLPLVCLQFVIVVFPGHTHLLVL